MTGPTGQTGPTSADWFDQDVKTTASPTFADVIITGLSGSIITTEGVQLSIEELDDSQAAEINTGFLEWTSGSAAATYTITGSNEFQIDRSFDGYIKGKKYSWAASIKTGALTVNANNWIYGKSDGTLDFATGWSSAMFEDYVVLFEVLYDGTNFVTVKENHPVKFQTATSTELHEVIGTVLDGGGADMTRVATGTGAAAGDREIKIVGADILHDHGLETTIPDSGGSGVTWNWYYTDGSGNWIRDASQTQAVMKWNDGGTATVLSSSPNRYGVWRMYVSKDDIENSAPKYFAVMGDDEYTTQGLAEAAIAAGVPEATNELFGLEMAQLGYIVVRNNASGGYVINILIEKTTLKSTTTGAGATNLAALISVDVTNFAGILSGTDLTVQIALDTIDDHLHDTQTIEPDGISSDGATFAFASTGPATFSFPDNNATAFSFKEGANAYLTFNTLDNVERIDIDKPVGVHGWYTTAQVPNSVGTCLQLHGSGATCNIGIFAASNVASDVPGIKTFRARGTLGSEAGVQSGDSVSGVAAFGYESGTGTYSLVQLMIATATGNYTSTVNLPTELTFYAHSTTALLTGFTIQDDGHIFVGGSSIGGSDNRKILWGAGKDASIYYDGTDFICDPKEVGTGAFKVLGDIIVADGYGINLQEDITWAGATGVNLMKVPDNLADALSVKDASGNVLQKFTSTTGAHAITSPTQPMFSAILTATQLNETGDSTNYAIVGAIWTELLDQGGDFSNGVFTAPVDGTYLFTGCVILDGIGAGHTLYYARLQATVRTYFISAGDALAQSGSGQLAYSWGVQVELSASDTVHTEIQVYSGAKTVDVVGAFTTFEGCLLY